MGSQVPASTGGSDTGLADPAAGPAADVEAATSAEAVMARIPNLRRLGRLMFGPPPEHRHFASVTP
jgi:hypothetical protein